ncbi:MAG: UDP-3-O-(3-hydroxymyristoyl)glucosamine N-acyltransferase [Elusimicrobia bacterium]|nr:UDP-3-O-(3-hydroxymyristoyl)glucosamine N-acyltransferase [Elusimicrobiota bacterium]MBP9127450.1 UDP-3-O-(3-hydroxymyristoyl)glucosamine N-acyltransferase [Elusimicrobiota bacterium]
MNKTLMELAERAGGTCRGDGSIRLTGAAGLAEAGPGDISFLANKKYANQLASSRAGAVIVSPDVETGARPALVHAQPSVAWAKVLELLDVERTRRPAGIHPTAVIAPTAKLGRNVTVGAHTVVEDGAVIGDNCILYPQVYVGFDVTMGSDCLVYPRVTIRERTTIGSRCIFQPGVVIGGDGFGFTLAQGRHYKIPQVGTVVIEDDVEIQANSTIDRGAVGVTRIGRGTKIDNLVQVAHGVEFGSDGLVAALTGIAGSTKIGHHVTLAAQVGVVGHIEIGDHVVAAARSGISHSLKPNQVVWGTPAQPIQDEIKLLAALRRVPKLLAEIKQLRKNPS